MVSATAAPEQSSMAYGRKKVRQFALLSLPGALFDYGRYIFESIPSPNGDFVAWTTLGGLAIVISFLAIWFLGYFSIHVVVCLIKPPAVEKPAWLEVANRSLWTLPYTAAVCSLAWIGYALVRHDYVDMPWGISYEFFFGLIAYGIGAWSVFILVRSLYLTLERAECPAKFAAGKMQFAAVVLGFVIAVNIFGLLASARIAADNWGSLYPIGTPMPLASRSMFWFPENDLTFLVVAATAWYLIANGRAARLIPVEVWILTIVSVATTICLFGLIAPHITGLHGLADEFGNTVLRDEGPIQWIDEVIWMLVSFAAIFWSVRKGRRKKQADEEKS